MILKNIKWYEVRNGSLLRTPWQSIDRTSTPLQGAQVGSLSQGTKIPRAPRCNQKTKQKSLDSPADLHATCSLPTKGDHSTIFQKVSLIMESTCVHIKGQTMHSILQLLFFFFNVKIDLSRSVYIKIPNFLIGT